MARPGVPSLLVVGDVLKTHPFEGYWGCALVLTAQGKARTSTAKSRYFEPMCHIAITSAVLTHDYDFDELRDLSLEVLRYDRGPRRETCIGIYSRKVTASVNVIGSIDVSFADTGPLTFVAGNAADGGWPLCGAVSQALGYEAVHAWRAVHDRERWLADVDAGRRSHEQMLRRLQDRDRQRRKESRKR